MTKTQDVVDCISVKTKIKAVISSINVTAKTMAVIGYKSVTIKIKAVIGYKGVTTALKAVIGYTISVKPSCLWHEYIAINRTPYLCRLTIQGYILNDVKKRDG